MKMEVTPSLPKVALVWIAVLVILFLGALGWIGGELHYSNCLAQAELEHQSTVSCSRLP